MGGRTKREATADHAQQVASALRAAYWAMHRQTNAALRQYGVTADQFVLLKHLSQADAMTQHELARRASSDPNTVRPMLELLQKAGLLDRRIHPTDKRSKIVVLTPVGRQRLKAMMRDTDQCRREMISAVRKGSAGNFIANLQSLAEALGVAPR